MQGFSQTLNRLRATPLDAAVAVGSGFLLHAANSMVVIYKLDNRTGAPLSVTKTLSLAAVFDRTIPGRKANATRWGTGPWREGGAWRICARRNNLACCTAREAVATRGGLR